MQLLNDWKASLLKYFGKKSEKKGSNLCTLTKFENHWIPGLIHKTSNNNCLYTLDFSELMDRENGGVSVALGYSVEFIDVYDKKVYLDTGDAISYEKCLIATGKKN